MGTYTKYHGWHYGFLMKRPPFDDLANVYKASVEFGLENYAPQMSILQRPFDIHGSYICVARW